MKLIAGRARCRLSSSAALVDELQQFSGAERTGEGLDFIALANRTTARATTSRSALCGRLDAPPTGPSSAVSEPARPARNR